MIKIILFTVYFIVVLKVIAAALNGFLDKLAGIE